MPLQSFFSVVCKEHKQPHNCQIFCKKQYNGAFIIVKYKRCLKKHVNMKLILFAPNIILQCRPKCTAVNTKHQKVQAICTKRAGSRLPSTLRKANTSLDVKMKAYLDLCLQGQSTIPQRKEMLTEKQKTLKVTIKELEDSVAYIDWKQNFYDEVLSGKRPYISNLVRQED